MFSVLAPKWAADSVNGDILDYAASNIAATHTKTNTNTDTSAQGTEVCPTCQQRFSDPIQLVEHYESAHTAVTESASASASTSGIGTGVGIGGVSVSEDAGAGAGAGANEKKRKSGCDMN